jgi:hypothetical protein
MDVVALESMCRSFTDLDQLATHTMRGLALDGAYKCSAQSCMFIQSLWTTGRDFSLPVVNARTTSGEAWVSFGYPAAQALRRLIVISGA